MAAGVIFGVSYVFQLQVNLTYVFQLQVVWERSPLTPAIYIV